MKKESVERKLAREAQAKLNRLYFDVLGEGGAAEILEDLESKFELNSMIRRGPDGRVDEFATLANNGAFEVISFIKQRIKNGQMAR